MIGSRRIDTNDNLIIFYNPRKLKITFFLIRTDIDPDTQTFADTVDLIVEFWIVSGRQDQICAKQIFSVVSFLS